MQGYPMTLSKTTTITKELKRGMSAIDNLYQGGFDVENLNAILRIANYAARLAASMSNAMLVLEDEQDASS